MIEGHWDIPVCPGGFWSVVPTQLGWHHKTSACFRGVTVSASVLVAGTARGWNLLVQGHGTMPTTSLCWAGPRQGTPKLLPHCSLTDISITFASCNPLSWAAIGAISPPSPTHLIFFFSKLLPLEGENKPWAPVFMSKSKMSVSLCLFLISHDPSVTCLAAGSE